MSEQITNRDLSDLNRTGTDVYTTVIDFGEAVIRRSTNDDLSILSISGVYSRNVAKEIERLCLAWKGNLGLEFKDIRPHPLSRSKFDGSVVGLLKTLQEKYGQRGKLFLLCSPPPELIDLLKLTGAIAEYTIIEQSSTDMLSKGSMFRATRPRGHPTEEPDHPREIVQKRILNLNQSLKRTVSLEKGLDSAEKCVKQFLPQVPPTAEGYSFAFSYRSSEKVGGDFFDFIELDGDVLGITIGDVSGHGIDAALLMGITKKVISIRAKNGGSPTEVLCQVNTDLVPDFHKYAFVTVLYGILHLGTGKFVFARAGHEIPIVFGPGTQQTRVLSRGFPVGTDAGKRFRQALEEQTIDLEKGSFLFLSTDGIPECRNERGQSYTRERLLFSISQTKRTLGCTETLDAILDPVHSFASGRAQEDDMTAILIHRLPEEGR